MIIPILQRRKQRLSRDRTLWFPHSKSCIFCQIKVFQVFDFKSFRQNLLLSNEVIINFAHRNSNNLTHQVCIPNQLRPSPFHGTQVSQLSFLKCSNTQEGIVLVAFPSYAAWPSMYVQYHFLQRPRKKEKKRMT